jgi:formylglycine-generating enzyme required for sulfatase activity
MGTSDQQARYLARNLRVDPEWLEDEQPQRRVYLDDYSIDVYPVTNAQYGEFVEWMRQTHDHSRCHPEEPANWDHIAQFWNDPKWNSPTQPAVGMAWWDAYAYAAWAGKRLPTEAEWERAARGTDGRLWPWGDEWDPTRCNVRDGEYAGGPTPVGIYPTGASPVACEEMVRIYPTGASPVACEEMAGNVWEWCADWFAADYYQRKESLRNPTGPESGSVRVLRGGSWSNAPWIARCADRSWGVPAAGGDLRGFRCALSPP